VSYYERPEEHHEPGEPDPTPAAGSTALLVVLVSVLVLVLCGGGVAALYLIGTKDRQPAGTAAVGGAATPTSTNRAASASAAASNDPSAIIKGQCVVNEGPQDAPVLKVVPCGPGTLQVLAKIDGTIDFAKCKDIPGSTHHYFYDTTPDTLDFVLCLKKM